MSCSNSENSTVISAICQITGMRVVDARAEFHDLKREGHDAAQPDQQDVIARLRMTHMQLRQASDGEQSTSQRDTLRLKNLDHLIADAESGEWRPSGADWYALSNLETATDPAIGQRISVRKGATSAQAPTVDPRSNPERDEAVWHIARLLEGELRPEEKYEPDMANGRDYYEGDLARARRVAEKHGLVATNNPEKMSAQQRAILPRVLREDVAKEIARSWASNRLVKDEERSVDHDAEGAAKAGREYAERLIDGLTKKRPDGSPDRAAIRDYGHELVGFLHKNKGVEYDPRKRHLWHAEKAQKLIRRVTGEPVTVRSTFKGLGPTLIGFSDEEKPTLVDDDTVQE